MSYPVITMGEWAHEGSRNFFLGENQSCERIKLTSVEKQITFDYPPTFVWCGMMDGTVDPKNSQLLVKALEEAKIFYDFLPIEGVDHGVGIGEGLACEGWFEKAVSFWENCRRKNRE